MEKECFIDLTTLEYVAYTNVDLVQEKPNTITRFPKYYYRGAMFSSDSDTDAAMIKISSASSVHCFYAYQIKRVIVPGYVYNRGEEGFQTDEELFNIIVSHLTTKAEYAVASKSVLIGK